MIEIGKYSDLEVKAKAPMGFFLTDGLEDVLLPQRHAPAELKTGDVLKVFVYLDNDNRPVATTDEPYGELEEFAFLRVKEVNQHGAFLDWGIAKDLFVAFSEQRKDMAPGEFHLVYIFLDTLSNRIAATTRWSQYLEEPVDFKEGDEVEMLIAEETDLGYRAIFNNCCEGLLYKNEVFEKIKPGDKRRGYIRVIRSDGKVDLRLQAEGYSNVENSSHLILKYLDEHKGILPLGDKSAAEDIYSKLSMSKKTFKKIIGALYKQKLVTIDDFEVRLVELE